MIPPLLAFVAGILLLQLQPELPARWLLPACLLPLPMLWALPRRSLPLLVLPALLLGFAWAGLRAHWRISDQLPRDWEGRNVQLQVVVADLPQTSERSVRLRLDVESSQPAVAAVPGHIQLNDYLPARRFAYRPGQRWQIEARLKRPHASLNPHGFDAESWLLQQNIRASGYIRSARLLDELTWRPGYLIDRVRDRLRQHMSDTLGQRPYAGVVIALAIGDQRAIPQQQWDLFARSGLTHLVSISGLHVTLVAGLVAAAAARLWRRREAWLLRLPVRKAALVAGGITALLYSLLAGFSVPTQRTLYMLLIAGWALWSGRSVSPWQILSLALAGVCLFDPWAVLAPGFWLSFGAVGWLIWAGSNRLQTQHWLQHWLNLQWALLLGLMPALLLLFQQLPLAAPLANALAIPLIGSIATPLCLLGMLIPPLLLLAHWLIEHCMLMVAWSTRWPPLLWQQAEPPLWALLPALPAVIWLTLPRGWPLRWMGLAGLLPLLWPPQAGLASGEFRLTMLDVGQGTAVVVRSSRHTLLYDTGPAFANDSNSGNRAILPFLRGAGVRQLDGLVLSHDDNDHTGGAATIQTEMPARWQLHSLPAGHGLLQGQADIACSQGQRWHWDGVGFEVLAPDEVLLADKRLKDNNRSCVIRISAACGTALLAGDIEKAAERRLLAQQASKLQADVLLVPHHGSKTSSTTGFVAAVAPEYALVSAGYRNRFGHPRAEVEQRYQALQAVILRTDRDGAIDMVCRHSGWQLQRERERRPAYWRD